MDLVITSNPDTIDEVEVLAHLGTSDHNMLRCETNYYVQPCIPQLKRDYKNAVFDQIRTELKEIDWTKELENQTNEQTWITIERKLKQFNA